MDIIKDLLLPNAKKKQHKQRVKSSKDSTLNLSLQTCLQWVWTNQCYFWVEPPTDCGFGEKMPNLDEQKRSLMDNLTY